jgi:hypothetical protein
VFLIIKTISGRWLVELADLNFFVYCSSLHFILNGIQEVANAESHAQRLLDRQSRKRNILPVKVFTITPFNDAE